MNRTLVAIPAMLLVLVVGLPGRASDAEPGTIRVSGASVSRITGDVAMVLHSDTGDSVSDRSALCIWRRGKPSEVPKVMLRTGKPNGFGPSLRWNPDGSALAFTPFGGWGSQVSILDTKTGDYTNTGPGDEGQTFWRYWYAFSPAGELLAHKERRMSSVVKKLRIVEVAAGKSWTVPGLDVTDTWAWFDDVILCSIEGEGERVLAIDPRTGSKTEFVSRITMGWPAAVSPDKERIAMGDGSPASRLFLLRRSAAGSWEATRVNDREGRPLDAHVYSGAPWVPGGTAFVARYYEGRRVRSDTPLVLSLVSSDGVEVKRLEPGILANDVKAFEAVNDNEVVFVLSGKEERSVKVVSLDLQAEDVTTLLELGQEELGRLLADERAPVWKRRDR